MAMGCSLALFSFLLATQVPPSDSGKILVFPLDGSHWLNMQVLVKGLHSRGHEVTVLRSSTSWYVVEKSPHYTSITIPQEQPILMESQEIMSNYLRQTLEIQMQEGSPLAFLKLYSFKFKLLNNNHGLIARNIVSIFEDEALMKRLQETGFDLVLTDPAIPVGVLVAHRLQLPLVLNVRWIINGEGHFAIAPSPLSYVPRLYSKLPAQMSFQQRLTNFLFYGLSLYVYWFVTNPPYQAVCERYFGPGVDIYSLMQGADLWLMRMDFIFEFPRPTMPNVVYVGGFHCQQSKPLDPELEAFVQSSGEHGVVLMSLGTLLGGLPPKITEKISSVFAQLPQKVIWRHLGERPLNLGNNTLLVKWIPQNDLLGHPKTKAFVTHGGTNGIYEAIYHGVPVVGIPLLYDQFDNMIRLEARGVARVLDASRLEMADMLQALRDVLEDPSYRQNMQRLSGLHQDQPLTPLDRALFWIEFVMRHKGAAHLRTESYKLPWYIYHSVDVVTTLLAIVLTFLALIVFSCWFLCLRMCKRKKSKLD
ncbi:UDB31 glucuronosyltransferase, partial [Amia calva]|nr:UDB31 glucuronosyltransferase [Amia calva]